MDIRAAEISSILKTQIANFGAEAHVTEVGQVLTSATASLALRCSTGPGRRNGRIRERDARHGAQSRSDNVGIVIFGADRGRGRPDGQRHRAIVDVPIGEELLGRVVGHARPSDRRQGPITAANAAGSISESARHHSPPVGERPMATGLKAIDAMMPIAAPTRTHHRARTETGKTALRFDTVSIKAAEPERRRTQEALLRYVAVGQTVDGHAVRQGSRGARRPRMSIIVAATASDPAPMQFLAPFSGCAMG